MTEDNGNKILLTIIGIMLTTALTYFGQEMSALQTSISELSTQFATATADVKNIDRRLMKLEAGGPRWSRDDDDRRDKEVRDWVEKNFQRKLVN